MEHFTVENYLIYVIFPILVLSTFFILLRFIKGPHSLDRIASLDLLVASGVGIMSVYCLLTNRDEFMDDAMILALLGFLGTIAFTYITIKLGK